MSITSSQDAYVPLTLDLTRLYRCFGIDTLGNKFMKSVRDKFFGPFLKVPEM